MLKLTTVFFCFSIFKLCSQDSYFQQDLDYKIKVELDDQRHLLTGFIEIKYKNNSPHILDKIGFHLWPNAYKHKSTAFAKQKIRMGDLNFHHASQNALGSIENLDFKVNGKSVVFQSHPKHEDIGWLILDQALLPNQEITISSPFVVKIPENFSRLGRGPESYQFTQWYPKPAVYDHKGWHVMPYLDYGEFYSEFGSFDVEITLPKSYVVAATGNLQTAAEIIFLDEKVRWTQKVLNNNIPAEPDTMMDAKRFKTIRYLADSLHDFAWFADKNFLVQKSQVEIAGEKKVDTWTFFKSKELWKEAIHYVNRSITFYSSMIGNYPWPQATAVESELNAGGGMEYPMITVIGTMYNHEQLDEVIAHEIAHNWFYGVIAFNERDHPFLDEGITSYYEQRYMRKYYQEENWFSDEGILGRMFRNVDAEKFQYLLFARPHLDQFPNQNADRFTSINYGNDVYLKTAKLFTYIENYLGREKLDALMSSFYEKWKFKHPYPEDLEDHFRQNQLKNLDWFFNGFISSDRKMDYRMKSLRKENDSLSITIENCNGIEAPFVLSGIRNDEKMESYWIDGFTGSKTLKSPCLECDYFAIDIDQESLDLYESNNYIHTKSAFKKIEKINLRLWPLIDKPRRTDIGLTPVINFNNYDGISPGLYISSAFLPFRKFKMRIMPFYGFRSKAFSGSAGMSYFWFRPDTRIHHWKFEIDFKKYAYSKNTEASFLNYYQLKPSITCEFFHLPSSQVKSHIKYTLFAEKNEYVDYSDTTAPGFSQKHFNSYTHVVEYSRSKTSILGNTSLDIRLVYFNQKIISPLKQKFMRTDISLQKAFLISKNRYANIRSFVSFFPFNSEKQSSSISSRTSPYYYRGSTGLTFQNYQDELNEYYFKGRTEVSGFSAQQLYLKQGAFKLPLGFSYRESIGNSNSFVAALNLSSDLPIPKIGNYLKPYFDLGYYQTKVPSPDGNWLWSTGIELELIPDILSFYFPITHSNNIRNLLNAKTENNYWKQISFTLNVHISDTELLQKIIKY